MVTNVHQKRAILANSGFLLLSFAVGGAGGSLLQVWGLEVLRMSPRQVGIAMGGMALSVPFQLMAIGWVNRVGRKRAMRLGFLGLLPGLALLELVNLWPSSNLDARFIVFIIAVVGVEICISCSWGSAWLAWVREFTSDADRGRFLATMRFFTQLTAAIALLLFSALIRGNPQRWHFSVLFAVLAAYVMFARHQYGKLPEQARPTGETSLTLWSAVHDKNIRRVMFCSSLQAVTIVPLSVSWLLLLAYPPFWVTVGASLETAVTLIALRMSAQILAKHSTIRVMTWVAGLQIGASLVWLTLSRYGGPIDGVHYLILVVVTTSAFTVFGVAWIAGLYQVIPEESSTVGFALVDLLQSSTAQLYALLCGVILTALSTSSSAAVDLMWFKGVFVLSAAATGALLVITRRMHREASSSQGSQEAHLDAGS